MFDFSTITEELERRAQQAEHAASCYRARQGPVPFADVNELETKAGTRREDADLLREEGGRRRRVTVAYSMRDGTECEIRLLPQPDGAIRIETHDDRFSDDLTLTGWDDASGAVVRVGETQEGL